MRTFAIISLLLVATASPDVRAQPPERSQRAALRTGPFELSLDSGVGFSWTERVAQDGTDVRIYVPWANACMFLGTGVGKAGTSALAVGYNVEVRREPAAWAHIHSVAGAWVMRDGSMLITLGFGREEGELTGAFVDFGVRLHLTLWNSPVFLSVPLNGDLVLSPSVNFFGAFGVGIGVQTL